MFRAKLKIVPFVLIVLAMTALLSHQAFAAADKPMPEVGPTISATVQSVDAGKRTLTVQVQAEKGKKARVEKTFNLAADVKVLLAHGLKKETKAGTLADLTEGAPVFVQLSPDEKSVLRVEVHGGGLIGSVKAVDAGKNTITVLTKDKNGPREQTLTLAKGARVLLDDGLVKNGAKEAKLGELGGDTPVAVQLSGYDRTMVVAIHAHGPTVHGSLKGVDASANTIAVTVKDNAGVEDRTYDLAKNVKSDGGKVSDLTAGSTVTLRLSVFDKKTVVAVHAHKSGE